MFYLENKKKNYGFHSIGFTVAILATIVQIQVDEPVSSVYLREQFNLVGHGLACVLLSSCQLFLSSYYL